MYISFADCIRLSGNKPFKGVIHIGAHHGEEVEAYRQCGVQNVVWVEASRSFMADLYSHTQRFPGIKQYYLNECMSDVDGDVVNFNIANNGQSSSILELGTHANLYPHINYVKSVEMKTKTFENVLQQKKDLNIDDYDFINLDVQGAELKVLKGFGDLLHKPNIKAVYTEINFEHVYKDCCLAEELDAYLQQFSFKRIKTSAPERTWGDALYVKIN